MLKQHQPAGIVFRVLIFGLAFIFSEKACGTSESFGCDLAVLFGSVFS